MDWNSYFIEQINKSRNHPLNKVNFFTWNQTGGFIRSLGKFLLEQNSKLRKWLQPKDYQRAVEQYQWVKE